MVFFSKKKSLQKVFFWVQKWSSFGLIFMKLGLPEKLGTLDRARQVFHSMAQIYRVITPMVTFEFELCFELGIKAEMFNGGKHLKDQPKDFPGSLNCPK